MGLGSKHIIQSFDICEQCYGAYPTCKLCWGHGRVIIPEDRCHTCQGRRVIPNTTVLEVRIRPGMWHGQTIVYKGEGNHVPHKRQGGIFVLLQEISHHRFKRYGNDLLFTMSLDINEAHNGFDKLVTTLDNRQIIVRNPQGAIKKNNDIQFVIGEGMPWCERPHIKGKMIVQFKVNESMEAVAEIMVNLQNNNNYNNNEK